MKTFVEVAAAGHSTAPPRVRRDWIVLLGLSAVFVISAWWRPAELPSIIACPFRALTGLPCPGCGMTRAFCALGHGEWRLALQYNALSPLVFLAALLAWAWAAAGALNWRRARAAIESLRPGRRAAGGLLALTVVWWLARLAGGF